MIVLSKMVIFFIASTNACLKSIFIEENLFLPPDSKPQTVHVIQPSAATLWQKYSFFAINFVQSITAEALLLRLLVCISIAR